MIFLRNYNEYKFKCILLNIYLYKITKKQIVKIRYCIFAEKILYKHRFDNSYFLKYRNILIKITIID